MDEEREFIIKIKRKHYLFIIIILLTLCSFILYDMGTKDFKRCVNFYENYMRENCTCPLRYEGISINQKSSLVPRNSSLVSSETFKYSSC